MGFQVSRVQTDARRVRLASHSLLYSCKNGLADLRDGVPSSKPVSPLGQLWRILMSNQTKWLRIGCIVTAALFVGAGSAQAWHAHAVVLCDINENGSIDSADPSIENVDVHVENLGGGFVESETTDAQGDAWITLPDYPDDYRMYLDPATLPSDAVVVVPAGGTSFFSTTEANDSVEREFLVDSEICRSPDDPGLCWMTGGGVKFERSIDLDMATHGPKDSLGGVVAPGCDLDPSEGGQWNHLAHSLKIHFQGWTVDKVSCFNIDGVEPGSESPVTPFNTIEWDGMGTIAGIHGNKLEKTDVYFWAQVQDRNEPGNEQGAKSGADIDRYFLHVFSDPANPISSTVFVIDEDGNPATVDPITITGGNLQLHKCN